MAACGRCVFCHELKLRLGSLTLEQCEQDGDARTAHAIRV